MALDQAGDLLEVVAADPRDIAVHDTGPGAAAELDPLRADDLVRRGSVVGAQQVQPERGPVPQPLAALAGGRVEIELECPARADPGSRHGVLVTSEWPQP